MEDINAAKLKVKQLKLLEGSPSDLEKSNIEEGLYALGFKIWFNRIEYPQYMLYVWENLLFGYQIINSYFKQHRFLPFHFLLTPYIFRIKVYYTPALLVLLAVRYTLAYY